MCAIGVNQLDEKGREPLRRPGDLADVHSLARLLERRGVIRLPDGIEAEIACLGILRLPLMDFGGTLYHLNHDRSVCLLLPRKAGAWLAAEDGLVIRDQGVGRVGAREILPGVGHVAQMLLFRQIVVVELGVVGKN